MSLSSLLIIFSSSFMALFPVINPLGNGFVVNGFFADLDPSQRKTAIQKLTINFIMIGVDRKSTRLNSSHRSQSRMPSSA